MMEYRFSLTPRLLAIGLFAVVALLVLLFALGFQLGQRLGGRPAASAAVSASRAAIAPSVPSAQIERQGGMAADRLRNAAPAASLPEPKEAP
jgi:hypothetical protein